MKHLDDKELLNISKEVLQSKPELYALYQERKKTRNLTRLLCLVVLLSLGLLFTFKCN